MKQFIVMSFLLSMLLVLPGCWCNRDCEPKCRPAKVCPKPCKPRCPKKCCRKICTYKCGKPKIVRVCEGDPGYFPESDMTYDEEMRAREAEMRHNEMMERDAMMNDIQE